MKVTLSAAMRARDVSQPRPEHLAEAAAREDSVPPRVHPAPGVVSASSPVVRPAPPAREVPPRATAPAAPVVKDPVPPIPPPEPRNRRRRRRGR